MGSLQFLVHVGRERIRTGVVLEGSANGADDVLAVRIVCVPIKILAEQVGRELCKRRVVFLSGTERGAGGKALEPASLAFKHTVSHSPKEHPDLGSSGTVVNVDLVEHDAAPVCGSCPIEECAVLRP